MKKQTKFKETEIGKTHEDWEERKIRDCIELFYGKGLPERQRKKGSIPVFGSNGIVGFHDEASVKGPGIIIGRKGSVGEITFSKQDFWPIDTTYYVQTKQGNDMGFWYYFLKTLGLNRMNSHSAVPGLNRDNVYEIDRAIPNFIEQRAIASILNSLDDKIALNRSMNTTLEAIGQALFRRWFIDFEFPDGKGKPYRSSGGEMVKTELGDVPSGWRVGRFADLAEINKGDIVDGPFGSNLKSSDYTDFGVRLIHQENIKEFNFINEKQRYTSFEKAAELQRSVAFPGDIVMTKMPEPITRAARIPHNISKSFIIMADCIRVRPNPELTPSGYLLYLINSKSFRQRAEGLATGTTRSRINLTQVKSIKIVIPPENCRKAFGMFSESLESLREKNSYEISILSSIRDALLPKLMSGEVRIEIPMSKKKVS
ncbi:MAG: restriction endonuclease subunit S [Euryarchaeota archaeon]|nr:restriction endonuclease subunit S [Euryarchaeota archaeon]